MKPADYLVLARLLVTDGDLAGAEKEAKVRTSISGAYYAVYLELRQRFFPAGSNVRRKHMIQQVMREFGAETAIKIRNLYQMRELTDYRFADPVSDHDAEECFGIANELMVEIRFVR